MDSCYSGDYIAQDHRHTEITTCNIIEEPQQKYCLGKVSNRLLGSGGLPNEQLTKPKGKAHTQRDKIS